MPHLREEDRKAIEDRFAETLNDDVRMLLFTESDVRSMLTIPGRPEPAPGPRTTGRPTSGSPRNRGLRCGWR